MDQSAVSDYFIEREFDRPCPSIRELKKEPQAQPYLANYLALLVKMILLNQFEQQVQSRYRYDMEHLGTSPRYFNRSISLLIALRMINANCGVVELIQKRCLDSMPAESIRPDRLCQICHRCRRQSLDDASWQSGGLGPLNRQPTAPLGTELEFSNLGFWAVTKNAADTTRLPASCTSTISVSMCSVEDGRLCR
jgi:hypothetical protein